MVADAKLTEKFIYRRVLMGAPKFSVNYHFFGQISVNYYFLGQFSVNY